ncbi:T9SS type A sorting domain-containing protein [Hymenobacter sp. GOD-10R]|uniref:T9SS type A sorting domain-containing protein n=1 Tax=Hymenobacter sp. GOD-10R TaxID=3093922 RepID=UPI002D799AAB|nr:T9SS type A sorting domain-containing protein [Hymenobacter sp. GOD-10R]WRQ27131.1 T9SS type A sorting domain-containing protein [Hymenobacter sp. GOD-10R]
MRFSFYSHISKKLASARVLLGASLLVLSPVLSWAQYTTSQNFESANRGGNLRYTTSGDGAFFSGNSGDSYSPENSPLYVRSPDAPAAINSFGVKNESPANNIGNVVTADINFRNVQFTGTNNEATLTFRLAVFSINGNGNGNGNNPNGLESNGSIVVGINPDSAANPTNYQDVLTIRGGGSGTKWSFTDNLSTPPSTLPSTPGYNNVKVFSSNSLLNTHYTQIRVSLATLSQAKIRIRLNASSRTVLLVDDVLISSNSPLPVELVRFTAEAQEKNVALHWITASEKNSDYFEVQRSTNGEIFAAIGKVQGEGTTSSISNYLFTDRAPVNGLAYYRLRQVDLDGTESYSPVQAVEWKGDAAVASFYPNPSAESITFTGTEGVLHYRIYNVKGQQVAIGEAASGSTVDLRAVPAGMYLLELSNKGQRTVQRFVRL